MCWARRYAACSRPWEEYYKKTILALFASGCRFQASLCGVTKQPQYEKSIPHALVTTSSGFACSIALALETPEFRRDRHSLSTVTSRSLNRKCYQVSWSDFLEKGRIQCLSSSVPFWSADTAHGYVSGFKLSLLKNSCQLTT